MVFTELGSKEELFGVDGGYYNFRKSIGDPFFAVRTRVDLRHKQRRHWRRRYRKARCRFEALLCRILRCSIRGSVWLRLGHASRMFAGDGLSQASTVLRVT